MNFEIPPLPYAKNALAPHISERTLDVHYEKHHKGYLSKLEEAVRGTHLAERTLEQIIVAKPDRHTHNLAAQVWNHSFYWSSMTPNEASGPEGELLEAVQRDFGSIDELRRELAEVARGEFGSGWAWLLADADGRLIVESTSDANNPLSTRKHALLTIDVWEHAYYLDYQNERAGYVEAVVDHLLNWAFADYNYTYLQRASAREGVERWPFTEGARVSSPA